MAGLVLCEPIELYNILNQATKLSKLAEPNYLCLLDVRSKQEYDESHVITALRVKKVSGSVRIGGRLATFQEGAKMGDFILDPGGGIYCWTLGSRGRTLPLCISHEDPPRFSHTP